MHRLRKHFSAQFCNLVAKTERGTADIERLYKKGWRILPGKVRCGGDADVTNKVIRVGKCKLICRMVILFHEIGHALNHYDPSMKKVSAHRSTVGQYVRAEIRDEYKSWKYAIDRMREIYADSPQLKHHFDDWDRLIRAGKRAQMFKDIREAQVTTDKTKPFEQYWADTYEKEKQSAVRKRKRTRKKNETSRKTRKRTKTK